MCSVFSFLSTYSYLFLVNEKLSEFTSVSALLLLKCYVMSYETMVDSIKLILETVLLFCISISLGNLRYAECPS